MYKKKLKDIHTSYLIMIGAAPGNIAPVPKLNVVIVFSLKKNTSIQ